MANLLCILPRNGVTNSIPGSPISGKDFLKLIGGFSLSSLPNIFLKHSKKCES